jgi:two-component system response regulator DctR
MTPTDTPTVFIVDDDASVREGLAWLLRTRRLLSESFDSAEAFLAMLKGKGPNNSGVVGTANTDGTWQPDPARLQLAACILLDVRMPGLSGLALFEQLLAQGMAQAWPVIFLTGHADVPTAVDSVKRGAFDFCEKPFSDNALVDRVEQALALSEERLAARQTQQRLQSRLLELTERERDVMRLVVEGLPNKLIADQLDISVRTVEVHRARVFDKMEVKSAVELANLMRQLT